jgi:EmrB/QacA subfamily drug resistance transporter
MSDLTVADPRPEAAEETETGARLHVVIGALMLSLLLAALDSTIVATALPTIVGDLGGLDQYSWVVTSYLLTFTVSTPLYGKLGDLYGRKRLFQAAIVIFLVGSALSGQARNMTELIVFRGLQGLGGGGLMVGSQAIIGDVVSPRERGRYQGYFGAVFGFASVAGPLVGGYLTDKVDWRWVFYVNLPIGLVALVAVAAALKTQAQKVHHTIDYLGSALMAGGVSGLILITTWGGNEYAWGSPVIVGLAIASVVLLGLFVWVESRVAEPLMPLRLFRSSVFTISCIIALAVGAALYGATTYLPQYQQVVRGESATASGLQLIPLMGGVVFSSLIVGQLISRTGKYRIYPIIGTALMSIALLLLTRLGVDIGSFELGCYMALLGLGIGMVMQMLVLVAQNSVELRDLGTATSTASFARSIGGSFGVALLGSVFNTAFANNQADAGLAAFTGDPTQLSELPEATRGPYLLAYADALDTVFMAAVPLAVLAFVFALLLKQVPLRGDAATSGDKIAGASASFGLAPLAAAGVMEEIDARVRAARAALDRIDELAPHHEVTAEQVGELRKLFEDRLAYLDEATGRVRERAEADDLPPARWKVLVELLGVERQALADSSVTREGAAGARSEAGARIAAAQAALHHLGALASAGKVTTDTTTVLRALFEDRITRVHETAEAELASPVAETLTTDGWSLVLEVLATERRELARFQASGDVDEATTERATRHLDQEAALVSR